MAAVVVVDVFSCCAWLLLLLLLRKFACAHKRLKLPFFRRQYKLMAVIVFDWKRFFVGFVFVVLFCLFL